MNVIASPSRHRWDSFSPSSSFDFLLLMAEKMMDTLQGIVVRITRGSMLAPKSILYIFSYYVPHNRLLKKVLPSPTF